MLISTNWLGRHVDLEGVDLEALGHRFTMAVAELDDIIEVGANLDTVVVGHVIEVSPVEGKRIQLTRVDTGHHGVRQIVCGAPNIAAGQQVPVALPGTTLGEMVIREAKVAGIASAGMIASEAELGIGDDHAGIMVLEGEHEPGTPLTSVYDLSDTLYELDNKSITHRPDLWGHRGVAREVAALLGRPLRPLNLADVSFDTDAPLTITVDDAVACPRYSAVTLEGVTVAPSPLWLRVLLHRVGTRPINNVVDATNFVMLDLGNPLHAFDRRQVRGERIVVRRATQGETFTTLDNESHELQPSDLLIADGERGVALAGVMGGLNSEISGGTTSVVLEAANFDAATIRLTAQRLGIRTESSARFEKGLDPSLVGDAARAFCQLLRQLSPGVDVTSAFMDVSAPMPEPRVIDITVAEIERRLGVAVGAQRIREILEGLAFDVNDDGSGALRVGVPSFRAGGDVGIGADLVEEVGRIYGYDNIPPKGPRVLLSRPHHNRRKRFERAARTYLSSSAGLDEVQTYSFGFDPLLDRIGAKPDQRLLLKNPISAEMPGLRRSLVPGLLGILEKNTRGFDAIRCYEIGRVFHPLADQLPEQPTTLAGMVAEVQADGDPDARFFFELKGVLAGLARAVGRPEIRVSAGGVDAVWAHPVRQASLWCADVSIGLLCDLHPLTLRQLDARHSGAVFELNLDALRAITSSPPGYSPLPRFPAVFRDFAVLVSRDVAAGELRAAIAGADPALITAVELQSVYTGAGVDAGDKSIAWSVTMRHPSRTLTDPEVRAIEERIWAAVREQVGGRPRA